MNKIVTTALGLAAVSSVGFADPGDSDWLKLDSEINGLATSLATRDGSGTTALLRGAALHGTDDISTGGTGNPDLSGFDLFDIDIAHHGGVGEFLYRISVDFDGGSAQVEDAYASFPCGPVNAMFGNFKAHVLRSADIHPENQLFFNRTILGSAFDKWDTGVAVSGEQQGLMWSFAVQNGQSGALADHFYAAMFSYMLGAGAGSSEGARGGNDDLNATLDVSVISDDTISGDQLSYLVGFNGNQGQIGFGLEIAQLDDDVNAWSVNSDYAGLSSPAFIMFDGDTTPYSATVSYLLNPDTELGVRYEDTDNDDNVSVITVGASFYQSGNNAKYQVGYSDVSADNGAAEGSFFTVGLVVGASS
jgi:hypothetical protein